VWPTAWFRHVANWLLKLILETDLLPVLLDEIPYAKK
jgi:hypothetical protein